MKAAWLVALVSLGLLTACGDAWGTNDPQAPVSTPDRATILANTARTNLSNSSFPWIGGIASGRLKRWDYVNEGPIPVKFNGVALAETAVNTIEEHLGLILFDQTSIADTPDDLLTRGIIVSEGTTADANGMVTGCGNVSKAPGLTAWPSHFYDETGRISTKLYVNLSSPLCTATLEIAIHEFGHALGMGRHFSGFGIGRVIDVNFWNVLFNIYTNDIEATQESLAIQQLP